jgi:hypothetical protein
MYGKTPTVYEETKMTDEQYEILKQDSAKKKMEWMERELKKLRH